MADPTKFTPGYSYTDWQTSNPTKPLPGNKVDQDMAGIATSIDQSVEAIKDVRRSDGALANGIVTLDSLDPTVAAGVGSGALASAAAAAASADAAGDSADAAASSAVASAASATAASGYAGNALTSRNEASGFADDSSAAATLAQTARDYANQWATAPSSTEVDDGVNAPGYSAYHWAQVALGAASGALPDGSVTETKIANGAVTRAKLAMAVTDELDAKADASDVAADLALKADASDLAGKADEAEVNARFSGRNLIVNGQGRINQGGYASGTPTTVANEYTLARWRVVTSGQSLSFTGDNSRRVMTAPAGGVEQVIEGLNVEGGTYVVNWTGTATCTVNGTSVSKGGTVTLPANTDATIRLISGTFTDVQVEPGSVVTRFERMGYSQELARCQRYGHFWTGGPFSRVAIGYADSATTAQFTFPLPVPLRTVNTAVQSNLTVNGIAVTAIQIDNASGVLASIKVTVAGGLTTGAVVQVYVAGGVNGLLYIGGEYV